jgi:hypothetical protein
MARMRVGGLKALVPLLLLLALVLSSPLLLDPGGERRPKARDPAPESAAPDLPTRAPDPPPVGVAPASLTGYVTSQGEPPGEGAWVMLSGLLQELRVDLDEEGNFHFREVPAGVSLDLWLGPDWTGATICRVAGGIVLSPGEHRFLTLSAPWKTVVRGRIVDAAGNGLEGVRVAVLPPGVDWRESVPVAATTSREGRFFVGFEDGVVPELMRLVVDHVAKGFILEERLVDPRTPAAREVEIVLLPGLAIAGRVLLPDGAPLANARVHLLEEFPGDGGAVVLPEERPEVEDPVVQGGGDRARVVARLPCEGLVRTDEEGRFRDDAYRPGVYRIFASGEAGGVRFAVVREGVVAGSEDVEIRFPGFGSVKLCFEDGTTGAPVRIIQGDLEFIYGHTGEEERFECWQSLEDRTELELEALPEGHYRVRVSAGGYESLLSDLIFVKAGTDLGLIRYRLTPIW